MDRYSDYARDLRKIPGADSFSVRDGTPPLREFLLVCDPRRLKSYKNFLDIERSREDRPKQVLPTTYKLRRIVVPTTRSQYTHPSRIPNVRDPRGLCACKKFNATSKKAKYVLDWVPTLVENDLVPQEEETCAVLVVDVSEWESQAIKSSYIELIPHECNVQRAADEARMQLIQLDDGLLMSDKEAWEVEKNMQAQASTSNKRSLASDDCEPAIEECDTDGESLPKQHYTASFVTVDDRPMLEVNDDNVVRSADGNALPPRPIDNDEDEDRIVYEPDGEPEERPVPRIDDADIPVVEIDDDNRVEHRPRPKPDDADVECIELDDDDESIDQVPSPLKSKSAADVVAGADQSIKEESRVQPVSNPNFNDNNDDDVEFVEFDEADERIKERPAQMPSPKSTSNPSPKPDDDADIVYVDLDDFDEPILPEKERQEVLVPFNKNLQREVLEVVTLDGSDEEEERVLGLVVMQLSKEESEHKRSKSDSDPDPASTCSNVKRLPLKACGLQQRTGFQGSEKIIEDCGAAVAEAEGCESCDDHCAEQGIKGRRHECIGEIGQYVQQGDCDSETTTKSDTAADTVISEFRPAIKSSGDCVAVRQKTEERVELGATEISDIADKATRSCDSDSDMPTSMKFETLADVHRHGDELDVRHRKDGDRDVIDAHSEISEETSAKLANDPTTTAAANLDRKRKRLDDTDTNDKHHSWAVVAVDKRRKECDDDDDEDVVANGENKSDKCNALVERALLPEFKTLPKKKRRRESRKKPSEHVLLLSDVSTSVIRRSRAGYRQPNLFFAFGALKEYLKNYTTTYNCMNFFCKNFEKLSVFELVRINQYVQSNNAFWQNRYDHWIQKENDVSIEVKKTNQLAVESFSAILKDQGSNENQLTEQKTVIEKLVITKNSQHSLSLGEGAINSTENSWLVQEYNSKDYVDEIKSQKRHHSLPTATIPQQSFGVKKLRTGSTDSPIKLTLRRNQADDNQWVATASSSTMPNISVQCTLSIANNSTSTSLKPIGENRNVISTSNNVCVDKHKSMPKWSYIEKEVPELYIDDLVNRPIRQKVQFDKSKLSLSLQSKVKKRSTSVDSAIVSDFDDNTSYKRQKITDSTKDDEQSMLNIFSPYDHQLSYHDNNVESLEITELPPADCTELLRSPSEDICNLNNYENTWKNSEMLKSSNRQDLPKDCLTNTLTLDQESSNLKESSSACLENINDYMGDGSSSESDSSFYLQMEDETDDSAHCKSHNFQKDLENTWKNSEMPKSSNRQDLPKDCLTNTLTLDQKSLNLKESNSACLENINDYMGDGSSSESDSSFHLQMEDETDDSAHCKSHNLQKDLNSSNEPCGETSNIHKSEINVIVGLPKEGNSDLGKHLYAMDQINKKLEALFGETNIDEVEGFVAQKYNCNKYQSDEVINMQKDQSHDSVQSSLQSIGEEKSTGNIIEKKCTENPHLPALDLIETGSVTAINKKQNQQTFNVDANTYASLGKVVQNQNETPLNNKKELAFEITPTEGQDKIVVIESSTDVQSSFPENVDQSENSFTTHYSQALINSDEQNQVESNNPPNSESNFPTNNQHFVIINREVDSKVSHYSHDDNRILKKFFHDQSDEHLHNGTMDVTNNTNAEHTPCKDNEMIEDKKQEGKSKEFLESQEIHQKQQENSKESSESREILNFHTPISSFNQDREVVENGKQQRSNEVSCESQEMPNIHPSRLFFNQHQELPEIIEPEEEGLEEGDFDFLASIQGIKPEYNDDDYDMSLDCNEYENQATVEHLKNVEVLKLNEDCKVSNHGTNVLKQDNQSSPTETEYVSNAEVTSVGATKSNLDNSVNVTGEDDDIIIAYEKISDSNTSKDVKPDISNINNGLNSQTNKKFDLNVSNLYLHKDENSEGHLEAPNIAASVPQSSLQDNDLSVQPEHLQTESGTENMDCSDESRIENPIADHNSVHSSALNNPSANSSTVESSVSDTSNVQILRASIPTNSTIAAESIIHRSTNDKIDFNNTTILEKFNLSREIVAPEDIKKENSVAYENNNEEQILCNTLENMLKDNPENECDVSKVPDGLNHSNKNVEVPLTTPSIVIEVSMPTEQQAANNYDLLKALNVNVDNEVDVIFGQNVDKNSAKHDSPVSNIKVKNLNDMLQKSSNTSAEELSYNHQNVLCNDSLPNVQESSQQNMNYYVEGLQMQSNMPVNMFVNNPLPNAYIVQPSPWTCIMNQPITAGPIQPLMNMFNIIPMSVPIMNNVEQQLQYANTGLVNQVPIQNNPQVHCPACPSPAVPTSDGKIKLASEMFPKMFDQANSSFCSITVFKLPLTRLENIVLPPPFTLLNSDNQETISGKIQKYKWALLNKIIITLNELEDIGMSEVRTHVDILIERKTLTEGTWKVHEKILIIAQCVSLLKRLTTEKSYRNVIDAIIATIHLYINDKNLLKNIFGIYTKFKKSGIVKSFADVDQPLLLELETLLKPTVIGMSSRQKEILKCQIKIYQEMLKINHKHITRNRVPSVYSQKKNQDAIQRISPIDLQQNIVTTTVSSPVTEIANSSLQIQADNQQVPSILTANPLEIMREQHGNEKHYPSKHQPIQSKAFGNKCDNLSKLCVACGKQSQISICCKCKVAIYCSHDCKTRHWSVHMVSCTYNNRAS